MCSCSCGQRERASSDPGTGEEGSQDGWVEGLSRSRLASTRYTRTRRQVLGVLLLIGGRFPDHRPPTPSLARKRLSTSRQGEGQARATMYAVTEVYLDTHV